MFLFCLFQFRMLIYLLLWLNGRINYGANNGTRRKKDMLYKHSANVGHIHTCWVSLHHCTTGRPSCPHRRRPLVLFYPREIKVTLLRWSRPYVRFPPIAQLICLENKNENESHQNRPDHLSGRSRCGLSWPLVGSVSTRTRIRQIVWKRLEFLQVQTTKSTSGS